MSLKRSLLAELEASRNTDLSGQKLAEKLGVSRNAVWKGINALRKDGHEILSGTNRGYRLSESSDLLSAEGISRHLAAGAKGLRVFVFKETDSTNNEAKRMLADGRRENFLVAAEHQTGGRGRNGRRFYSPSRAGIYMTLAIHPGPGAANPVSITTAAAVAVVRAIEKLTDKKPLIKWVNDIFLDGGKICGILTEAIMDVETGTIQSVIVGIGVNVSAVELPEELNGIAAALEPSGLTRNRLAAEIINQIMALAADLSDKSYLEDYRARSMVLGKRIAYCQNGVFRQATAVGIDENGGLLIRNDDGGTETLTSGEISVRPV